MRNFEYAKGSRDDKLQDEVIEHAKDRSAEKERLFGQLRQLIAGCNGPEEFFSSERYEQGGKFEKIVADISNVAREALLEKDFSTTIDIGRELLEVSGIEAAREVSIESPNDVIALAEAINWAAKTISYQFYSLKPAMVVAAAQTDGVFFGYGYDGAYYLGTPTIGVASFHDPDDEVGYIMTHHLKERIPEWEYNWSGVYRQDDAFRLLGDLTSGRELTEIYAKVTSPQEMREARDRYMKQNFHDRLATIGDLLRERSGL